jgi:uncharacterized protein involved in exopolysaccharide biosynthesis
MEEDVKTLGDYVSIAWRRKFHILIPTVLVLAATISTVYLLPPVYQSTGTILIESQQIPAELIQSTVTSYANERIQIIKQRIMTSQQLFGIIQKFNLYADQLNSTARSDILADMRGRISINRVSANVKNKKRGTSALIAFTVSFQHEEAGTAQKVANELVTLFLDENIKSRTARAEETSDFLKNESDRLGDQITAMEQEIASYKQQNKDSLPEALALNLQRLADMKAALIKSDDDLTALEERKKLLMIDLNAVQRKLETTGGLSQEKQQQKQELQKLQKKYISLSARYGLKHPDVKAIKRQISAFELEYGNLSDIDELKAQEEDVKKKILDLTGKYSTEHPDVKRLERELASIVVMIGEYDRVENASSRDTSDPKLLQLKAKLESIDNSIAKITKGKAYLQDQIIKLDNSVNRTPQVKIGLDVLRRDQENIRRKYQEMKSKQLQAELSQSLEEEQKGERFTLLEPPLFPDKPVKPDRPKLFMMGLILSFASGIGVAGLAEVFDGGIRGARALASVTKMTPLVAIPYIATRKDEAARRRKVKIFIAVVFALVVIGIAMVHFFYKPLDLLWFIALRKLNLT